MKGFLYHYTDFEDELSLGKSLFLSNYPPTNIVLDEALEDIEYLFSIFKYGYAGYEYFGGDNLFYQAKNKIIYEISYKFKNTNSISVDEFNEILCDNLGFIQDGHLSIGSYQLSKNYNYYSNEYYNFLKDEKGYYFIESGEREYLRQVNNKLPEEYIKKSLDEEGNIVYSLGLISDTEKFSTEVKVELESENIVSEKYITLSRYEPADVSYNKVYDTYDIENIHVIKCTGFFNNSEYDKDMEYFIKDAKSLREKDIIILDLRGNGGGEVLYISRWYNNFTQGQLNIAHKFYYLLTNTVSNSSQNDESEVSSNVSDENTTFFNKIKENKDTILPGWSYMRFGEYKLIENNIPIFVLLDKRTASAAELFLHSLRQLNNVVYIGTNSQGMNTTGNSLVYYLPNSNLKLFIPEIIIMHLEGEKMEEGIGFYPDLWVKPKDSMERIIKYINNTKEK
nr:S41 family peptidase [Tissierella simiarum]